MTNSICRVMQQVLCGLSHFLDREFFIRHDQLKAEKKAVIDLCITERSNEIFRLLVNLSASDLFQPSGHAFLGTLLCGADTAFCANLQSVNLAVTILRDKLSESVMYCVFLVQRQERVVERNQFIVREALALNVPHKVIFDIFNRIRHG